MVMEMRMIIIMMTTTMMMMMMRVKLRAQGIAQSLNIKKDKKMPTGQVQICIDDTDNHIDCVREGDRKKNSFI